MIIDSAVGRRGRDDNDDDDDSNPRLRIRHSLVGRSTVLPRICGTPLNKYFTPFEIETFLEMIFASFNV